MDPHTHTVDSESLAEHSEWVRALARSLVRDPGSAEDIAQETWIAVLRRPPDADRSVRAWLAAVARNAARQLVRTQNRRTRCERHSAREEALPSDHELAERVALQQWVVAAVMTLDEPYRRTILLRFFEDLPPREIAARMDVPLETVKSRLRRAIIRLRERLASQRGPGGECGVHLLLPLVSTTPWSVASGVGIVLMGKKSLLLAAAVLMLLLSGALYEGLRGPMHPAEAERAPGPNAGVSVTDEMLATKPEVEAVVSAEAEGSEERRSVAAVEGLLLLRTIESDSGMPVPNAQVWVVPTAEVSGRNNNGTGESFDIEATVAALSRGVRTDDQGELRIQPPERHSIAVARQGELFGLAYFLPEAGETVEIQLLIDRSITVQTITDAGEPLSGIPVGIAKCSPNGNPDIQWWALTTGEKGQVTLHHLDHTLQDYLETGVPWIATLATPCPNPPTFNIDTNKLPRETIQLVVEPGGRVVVRVENDKGELLPDQWVHLTEMRKHRDAVGRNVRPMRHSIYTRDGLAVFENVALGLDLRSDTRPRDYRPIEVMFAGPKAPGEEIVVRLSLGKPSPTLSGILVETDGSPIISRAMDARIYVHDSDDDDRTVTSRFRTDEEGRFELSVTTRLPDDIMREVLLATDESYEGQSLSAIVVLEDLAEGNAIDLGRVVLEPPPVILAGRVVDAQGEPIYWATTWVKRMTGTNGIGGPPYHWVDEWQSQTDRDGRFQLLGDQGPGDYRLIAGASEYQKQRDIPFQPGDADIEIVLHKSGGLEGSLILPKDIPPNWLRVSVKPDDVAPWWQASVRPNPDGSFYLPDLEPGEVDVTVFLPAWREPLARVADVHVEGDAMQADPRLARLDLTDAIHRIDLEVLDPDGKPVPIGCVTFSLPEDAKGHTAFTEGSASLLAPSSTVNAEILAPGFRPQRIEGARDGLRITLERGIPVRVKLPEDFELPDPPMILSIQLLPIAMTNPDGHEYVYADDGSMSDRWGRRQYSVSAALANTQEVILKVGSPGSWQVSWTLGDERWSGGVRGASGYPDRIEIDEAGPSQVIELAPNAKEIEELIAKYN